MKKIYIVLTYTGTILSRLVKYYTKKEYSHVSISLDENLEEMYSFGRLNAYIPFIGGIAATGIAVIPLAIAAGYGIRKLIKKI